MKKNKAVTPQLTEKEIQLVEHLRLHPEMMARFQTILDLTGNAEGPLKTADEVEELLIEEMRRLGNVSLSQWAAQAEERVSGELRAQDATVLSRKKKR